MCPRSSDPFYVVTNYIKWVTTTRTYSSNLIYKMVTTSWTNIILYLFVFLPLYLFAFWYFHLIISEKYGPRSVVLLDIVVHKKQQGCWKIKYLRTDIQILRYVSNTSTRVSDPNRSNLQENQNPTLEKKRMQPNFSLIILPITFFFCHEVNKM